MQDVASGIHQVGMVDFGFAWSPAEKATALFLLPPGVAAWVWPSGLPALELPLKKLA